MGLSSVDATNVLRMCAVRAMRSALLAFLPLLAGLRLFDALLAGVLETFDFEVVVEAEPAFDFVLLAAPVLPVDDFFFAEDVPKDFCPSELCPEMGNVPNASASTTTAPGSAEPRRNSRRNKAFINSLYLYLCLLDA